MVNFGLRSCIEPGVLGSSTYFELELNSNSLEPVTSSFFQFSTNLNLTITLLLVLLPTNNLFARQV